MKSPKKGFFRSMSCRHSTKANKGPGIEETSSPYFTNGRWFLAAPGQVLESGYSILTKLGYGATSTVWLAHDKQKNYVAIKICVSRDWKPAMERVMLDKIEKIKQSDTTQHPGAKLIRGYIGSFRISAKCFVKHTCIVYSPLGPSLEDVRNHYYAGRIPPKTLQSMATKMLLSLDWLHKSNLVHADIHAGNYMMLLTDQASLEKIHRDEVAKPSIPLEIDGRLVYKSRMMPPTSVSSVPILCDFSSAQSGKEHNMDATPNLMRPPEVILQIPWSEKLDIWCLGLVIWQCIEGRGWYEYRVGSRRQSELDHMAWTVALLGTPTRKAFAWMKKSKKSSNFFDDNAQFKQPTLIPQATMLDRIYGMTSDHTERKAFFCFISKMLQWEPESRASAAELLEDPWLKS